MDRVDRRRVGAVQGFDGDPALAHGLHMGGPEVDHGDVEPGGGEVRRDAASVRAGGQDRDPLVRNVHALFSAVRQCGNWCRLQESNPRPTDYKSAALPTELSRLSKKMDLYFFEKRGAPPNWNPSFLYFKVKFYFGISP